MFHTPPVKSDWQTDTSITNSYDLGNNNDSNSNYSDNDSQPATLDTEDAKDILKKSNLNINLSDDNLIKNINLIQNSNTDNDTTKTLTTISNDSIVQNKKIEDNDFNIDIINNMNNIDNINNSDNSSFIESFDIISEDDLPMTLLKLYEQFLKELKEPKFDRSLASFEIAELFQSFYQRFHISCCNYIDQEGKFELHDKNHNDLGYKYYEYNLTLERLLCDKFYNQIIFPLKNMEIDEYEKDFNDKFCDKLGCLSSLDIHFENLDIDLPKNLESIFINELDDKILPEFELLTAERSPTLKMKYLIRIHKKIGQIIHNLTKNSSKFSKELNTDIYLPILIFTIIKLKELRAYFLVRQLNLMKRFSNEFIFDNSVESLQIEKGKLLYVCANFEAAISYLSSVTLDNLDMPIPSEDINLLPGSLKDRSELIKLLTTSLKFESIEEKTKSFKKNNPLILNSIDSNISINDNNSIISNHLSTITNSWVDYSKSNLPSVNNADQSLKSFSQAIDSSLKNIIGKVSWISGSSDNINTKFSNIDNSTINDLNDEINDFNDNNDETKNIKNEETINETQIYTVNDSYEPQQDKTLSDSLLKQLEENIAFEQVINVNNDSNANNNSLKAEHDNSSNKQHTRDEVTPTTSSQSTEIDKVEINNLSNNKEEKTLFPSDGVDNNNNTNDEDEINNSIPHNRTESNVSVNTQGTEGSLITKLTSSVGGVMKNFRPVSASSSTTSLNVHLNEHGTATTVTTKGNTISGQDRNSTIAYSTTPNKNIVRSSTINMRSRATSFINTSLFGSPTNQSFVNENNNISNLNNSTIAINTSIVGTSSPNREYRNSIFSSLENAFDNVRNRSRDNSLGQGPNNQSNNLNNVQLQLSQEHKANIKEEEEEQKDISNNDMKDLNRLLEEIIKFKRFDKNFGEMSINDLNEMYTNYQYIMSHL